MKKNTKQGNKETVVELACRGSAHGRKCDGELGSEMVVRAVKVKGDDVQ